MKDTKKVMKEFFLELVKYAGATVVVGVAVTDRSVFNL